MAKMSLSHVKWCSAEHVADLPRIGALLAGTGSAIEEDMNTQRTYAPWISSYSNEDFDRAQRLSYELGDEERAAGKTDGPSFGCSKETRERAEKIVLSANRYAENFAGPVPY